MAWPYTFPDLTAEQKHDRRLVLNRYGIIAQASSLAPILVFLAFRGFAWARGRASPGGVAYDAVPTSPGQKHDQSSANGTWKARRRRVAWWLGDEVRVAGLSWGRRDELVFGFAWAVWLLFLCFVETGEDYFHLTKRFGQIAASQFPIQYLLSLKYLNPVAYAMRSSHEDVNRWHRVLGRIIHFLLILHGVFYVNAWVQLGNLGTKLTEFIVILGILGLAGMSVLATTALAVIRVWSYRVFFITHLVVAFSLPPIIFLHVHHARLFMAESLLVLLIDLATRKLTTATADTTVTRIPGTNLLKVQARVPLSKAAKFATHPASHVYMSLPSGSRPNTNRASLDNVKYELIYNPFTVASVDDKTGELTLVVRELFGPMTQNLGRFASGTGQSVPLSIDGPYGASKHFPNLGGIGGFDRVLLFAGGVGATFILPLFQAIIGENPTAHVEFVWAVRDAAEATWCVTNTAGAEPSILDNDRLQLFLTGSILGSGGSTRRGGGSSSEEVGGGGGMEMGELSEEVKGSASHSKRPDLQKIVDNAFRKGQGERVAVLVCGPGGMARDVRSHVGAWVRKGREVWWHNEHFGW